MGSRQAHDAKAQHLGKFLRALDKRLFPDVSVITLHLQALHAVESLYADEGHHSHDHAGRNDRMRRGHPAMWGDYKPLFNRAKFARYDTGTVTAAMVADGEKRLASVEAYVASTRANPPSKAQPPAKP